MKTFRWVVIAVLVAGIGMIAAGWAVTLWLSEPNPERIGAAPRDLRARDVVIHSESGADLHGWYVVGRSGRGAIALLHGVHANRLAMLGRARSLAAAGYAVLLIDFQAHGESGGEMITFGLRESDDARAAVAYLRRAAPAERIGVVGVSMGGAASLLATPVLGVDALVLEQVYPTIEEALDNRLRLYLGPFGALISPLIEWEMSRHLDLEPVQLHPIDRIADVRVPVLIIAGEADKHTLLTQSRALFAAANEPKTLWIVPGAAHVDLQAYAGEEYARHVLEFFAQTLTVRKL